MVRVSAARASIKALSVSDGMMGTFNLESTGFRRGFLSWPIPFLIQRLSGIFFVKLP